jgi:hypothetical protein
VDIRARAEIALELARVMGVARNIRGALAVLDRVVTEVGDTDPALRVRLEAEFVTVARRYPATREQASQRLQLLSGHAQPGSLVGCVLLANLAADALEVKGPEEATRLADAALREDHLLVAEELDVALLATSVLMSTDQLDTAWRTWNAAVERPRRQGALTGFAAAATVRAALAYRCGQLMEAEADARLAGQAVPIAGRPRAVMVPGVPSRSAGRVWAVRRPPICSTSPLPREPAPRC